jgi:DNA-binding IclR family transcriptional regulator
MTSQDGETTLKTTETSLSILEFIRESNGATLSEVMEAFDLAKSTAYTHLHTLETHGYIVSDRGEYRIGLRFLEFSKSARTQDPIYDRIEATVFDLSERLECEVEFLVEENGRIVLVYHSEGPIDQDSHPYMYSHTTAAGKAILAELPDERVHEIIDQWGLPRKTENTITDVETLFEELETVRERGYGYNRAECFEGYHGIGAVVTDIDDRILGALTLGGPLYRLSEDHLKGDLADEFLAAVEDLEASIERARRREVLEE